jgi:biopolymer transport protein ExbD
MAFGRFERVAEQKPMSEINVTPLVDVMMVLLVIFIITTPLMMSALKLDLPKAQSAPTGAAQRVVSIAINAQGDIYLDKELIDLDALANALRTRANQATQDGVEELPEVQLQADVKVPYGRVVEVMGLVQQAGLSRIGFVTERKP